MRTVVERAKERGVEIPEWVPEVLRHEYADAALAHGEETAASHVRKLKKEMLDRAQSQKRRRPF